MSIGKTYKEAMQKAIRSLEINRSVWFAMISTKGR